LLRNKKTVASPTLPTQQQQQQIQPSKVSNETVQDFDDPE